MLSLTNSQKILQANSQLFSPIQVDEALLICSFNGDIIKNYQGQTKGFAKVTGHITSIGYDQTKNTYYLADQLNSSIIALSGSDKQQNQLVSQYQGQPLLGPNSLIISKKTGNVFFTDSGPFGQTLPPNNKGSVFVIDMQLQSIRPIALRYLSNPSGLAFGNDQKVLYVAQTGKNRILRMYEAPEGVFYTSVFHNFNGRYGPTALASTAGKCLLVALYQFSGMTPNSQSGMVAVLNESGQLKQRIKLPLCGPQLTGLFISKQNSDDMNILVTQNGSKGYCHRVMMKIDKDQHHDK